MGGGWFQVAESGGNSFFRFRDRRPDGYKFGDEFVMPSGAVKSLESFADAGKKAGTQKTVGFYCGMLEGESPSKGFPLGGRIKHVENFCKVDYSEPEIIVLWRIFLKKGIITLDVTPSSDYLLRPSAFRTRVFLRGVFPPHKINITIKTSTYFRFSPYLLKNKSNN